LRYSAGNLNFAASFGDKFPEYGVIAVENVLCELSFPGLLKKMLKTLRLALPSIY